jgi:hypothetical protein
METAKNNIRICVDKYISIFPDEYKAFKEQPPQDAHSANMDTIETKVAEYPENLYMLILKTLSDEQMKWLDTKEGINWFVKAFPVFGVKYNSKIV